MSFNKFKLSVFIVVLVLLACRNSEASNLLDSAALANEKLYMSISDGTSEPDKVYKLCMGGREMTDLSDEILVFPNLQEINISQNNLVSLPDFICNLNNLEEIRMSANFLRELPSCLPQLSNLKRLDMSGNINLNWEKTWLLICNITSLEELDLSYNDITFYPPEIMKLKNLKKLDLSGNKITKDDLMNLKKLYPNIEINY